MHGLLLLAMTFGMLSAQNAPTWGGLSFGMTETQVRAILGSKMLKAGPGPDEQPADTSSHLFIGGKVRVIDIKGFEGDASLGFDKTSKRLSLVSLFLKPLKDSSDEDRSAAYKRLREDLLKKYGSPVERAGCSEAEITDSRTLSVECHLIFRSKGQTIDASMSSWHGGVPLLVYITYERIAAMKGI